MAERQRCLNLVERRGLRAHHRPLTCKSGELAVPHSKLEVASKKVGGELTFLHARESPACPEPLRSSAYDIKSGTDYSRDLRCGLPDFSNHEGIVD
jgi:hypothetical protein